MRRVITDAASIRGVMPLLMKPRNGESWTPEERAELLAHMRCLAHLSPYLVLLLLPGSAFVNQRAILTTCQR